MKEIKYTKKGEKKRRNYVMSGKGYNTGQKGFTKCEKVFCLIIQNRNN